MTAQPWCPGAFWGVLEGYFQVVTIFPAPVCQQSLLCVPLHGAGGWNLREVRVGEGPGLVLTALKSSKINFAVKKKSHMSER